MIQYDMICGSASYGPEAELGSVPEPTLEPALESICALDDSYCILVTSHLYIVG